MVLHRPLKEEEVADLPDIVMLFSMVIAGDTIEMRERSDEECFE